MALSYAYKREAFVEGGKLSNSHYVFVFTRVTYELSDELNMLGNQKIQIRDHRE